MMLMMMMMIDINDNTGKRTSPILILRRTINLTCK